MKLLIEFVSFNIYFIFIWETAGYSAARSPSGRTELYSKRAHDESRQGKQIQNQSLRHSYGTLRYTNFCLTSIRFVIATQKVSLAVSRFCNIKERIIIYYESYRDILKHFSPKNCQSIDVNKQLTCCAIDDGWVIEKIFSVALFNYEFCFMDEKEFFFWHFVLIGNFRGCGTDEGEFISAVRGVLGHESIEEF